MSDTIIIKHDPLVISNSLISIRVPVDSECRSAYFEVYNNTNIKDATHVAKLRFNDDRAEYHNGINGKKLWYPNNAEEFIIRDLLNEMYNEDYTNWDLIRFEWNRINGMFPEKDDVDIDAYFSEKYDDMYANMYESIKDTYYRWVPTIRILPSTWYIDDYVTDEMYMEGVINYVDENKYFTENGITVNPDNNYYTEMATIAKANGIRIVVVPEANRLTIAYFKVYNSISVAGANKVARLHFKDNGMEIHKSDPDGKNVWVPTNKEIKKIRKLLSSSYEGNRKYTNWQYLCYQWNIENNLISNSQAGIDDYFSGKYDHRYDNDPRMKSAYVPSTTQMPETWGD